MEVILSQGTNVLMFKQNGITYTKKGYYWYEDSCWRCSISTAQVPVDNRTRYPNISDTDWACNKCEDEITKEYEETRDLMYKESVLPYRSK